MSKNCEAIPFGTGFATNRNDHVHFVKYCQLVFHSLTAPLKRHRRDLFIAPQSPKTFKLHRSDMELTSNVIGATVNVCLHAFASHRPTSCRRRSMRVTSEPTEPFMKPAKRIVYLTPGRAIGRVCEIPMLFIGICTLPLSPGLVEL